MKKERLARCSLCNGSMPASDRDTRIEHMMKQHGADSEEQARTMSENYFSEIYDTPEHE